jgi:hypothetical protein
MCDRCGATVMLGNALAAGEHVPDAATLWLAARGWAQHGRHWRCGQRHE